MLSHLLSTTIFSATLAWDANNDSVTAGYRVIAKTGVDTLSFDVGASTSLSLDFAKPGWVYLFQVVAYSYDGIESDPSDLLDYDVPIPFGWPTLLSQPVSVSVFEGAPAFFVAQTAGTAVRFKWLKNGEEIAGATNIFLSIPSVTPAHVGHYSVRVANLLGEIESESAELSLLLPPTITSQSRALRVREGDPIFLSVEADGTDPLTYRWTRGSELVQEGDAPLLFLPESGPADAGIYEVAVLNEFGSALSEPIEVVVEQVKPPSVTIERLDSNLVLVIRGYPWTGYLVESCSQLDQTGWIPLAEIQTDGQGNAMFPLNSEMEVLELFRIIDLWGF